ncbi:hypothetical protein COEREDRAFT_79805 [Coemansia reversa NRRL 1564]|uniref:Uncharacterized protein n=1 Tax=Coemansia reversa (strain ATCC 12441 / NRRL 1564) TaxID=763665 RepID=A0A2G5BH12_COERN|nr:hypothetical protein COEREDRAFT_79805 [Coemansia reversa NRRL 1564]|eukprot:PIA18308.1 hypothetical protein COEREDRAFT_79805 [Coemansia reversa NRRL 1564]
MAPVTRRQSRRLTGNLAADESASNNAEPIGQSDRIGSVGSRVASGSRGGGRVSKPERTGRIVASRYKSGATKVLNTAEQSTNTAKPTMSVRTRVNAAPVSRKATPARTTKDSDSINTNVSKGRVASAAHTRAISTKEHGRHSQVATTPKSTATSIGINQSTEARVARRASRRTTVAPGGRATATATPNVESGTYATYLQWLMIEARSQIQYDEAKSAAHVELERLANEAEAAKQALFSEQRRLKLMREHAALSKWMSDNRKHLVDMNAQVNSIRAAYTKFGENLAQTTHAMPISDVYFTDTLSLEGDIEGFVNAVSQNFPADSEEVQSLFLAADKLGQYYRGQRQEQELLSECQRLRQSLEHTTTLAISRDVEADRL